MEIPVLQAAGGAFLILEIPAFFYTSPFRYMIFRNCLWKILHNACENGYEFPAVPAPEAFRIKMKT
jgi:hypothetical protein